MKYRCVVFDLDGTLLDSETVILTTFRNVLRKVTGRSYKLSELKFSWGIPTEDAARRLGVFDIGQVQRCWNEEIMRHSDEIRPFPGTEEMLRQLRDDGVRLGIVTSKDRYELELAFPQAHYFEPELIVTADQTARHKPDPKPLLELLRRAGIRPEQALYIGDTIHDARCAAGAGVAFGLAAWGADLPQSIRAEYYFAAPREVAPRLDGDDPLGRLPYLKWAMELQFIGQAGVTYSRDPFDRERFQRIREIAAGMLAAKSEMPLEKVKELFCSEHGFQTPKLDTRAAIFRDGKILLVRENDGRWSLPGGWVDVNESIRSNTEKEVREEAGLTVAALRLIAAQDRNRHNPPPYAYGVCKIFVLCGVIGGEFRENLETTGCAYFGRDELPQLAEEKNTAAQIRMCFDAAAASDWQPVFD